MPTYQCRASIDASREAVWRILANIVAWPEWLPTVTKVEALNETTLRPGARFVVHQPRLRPATWTVVQLRDLESFVWAARMPGLEMVAQHTVETRSPAHSVVVLRFSFNGLLGTIAGMAYRRLTEDYLAQEAAALKRTAEAAA